VTDCFKKATNLRVLTQQQHLQDVNNMVQLMLVIIDVEIEKRTASEYCGSDK
jgi:hypothetical protein